MVVPRLWKIFEVDLKSILRSGIQRLLARTECRVGALLDRFPVVVCKGHLEINFAYWRTGNILQNAGDIANSNGSSKSIAGRNAQVSEFNRRFYRGRICNFREFGKLISVSAGPEGPANEDRKPDKHCSANNENASTFHITLR